MSTRMSYPALLEAVGVGPASEQVVADVSLLGNDAHSGASNAQPVRLSLDGTPTYTYERWLRLRFTPPFGVLSNFRIWATGEGSDTADIRFGIAPTYATPTRSPSVYASASIPADKPTTVNIGTDPVDELGMYYTPWVVFQASVTNVIAPFTLALKASWLES